MQSNTLSCQVAFSDKRLIYFLKENKVILAPSDTVWGLCGAATKEVFEKLNELKVRNEKPYLLLVRSLKDIQKYAVLPEDQKLYAFLKHIWPGPVTVLFKALPSAPSYMVGQGGTIAFRIPRHEGLQALLAGVPVLFSTSANISGKPVPTTFEAIDASLRQAVALCVSADEAKEGQIVAPSTIINISTGDLRLVREGAIPFAVLQMFLNKKEK
jgi:L-threonylcarbamoyladenylate synthase